MKSEKLLDYSKQLATVQASARLVPISTIYVTVGAGACVVCRRSKSSWSSDRLEKCFPGFITII